MQKSKTRFVPLAALFLALILSASGRVDAQGHQAYLRRCPGVHCRTGRQSQQDRDQP